MSKCMTIADESIDQKDTCTEIAPKDIVEFILEEVLLSALIISDKGCSRIGDFSVTEDFCQQYDRFPVLKDFEQVNYTGNPSATNQESTGNSGKSIDRSVSLVTARENLESIIDSFVKKEDKISHGGECTIITEDVLADNELQIQNGHSHIEKNNKKGNGFPEAGAREYFDKKDVIKDEKIEIQYYNEGKLSKIYVPLIPSGRLEIECAEGPEDAKKKKKDEPEEMKTNENEPKDIKTDEDESDNKKRSEVTEEDTSGQKNCTENTDRPFKPFSTEEFRQVWENLNSSLVGKWDGDVSARTEEVVSLMEELSSVQVFPDGAVDPNRPRACAFGEEDVKKIIKEIEEISFTQGNANLEDSDMTVHPDGQGDADIESRSFTHSKDSMEKTFTMDKSHEELLSNSLTDDKNSKVSSEKSVIYPSIDQSSDKTILSKEEQFSMDTINIDSTQVDDSNIRGEQHLQYQVIEEESQLHSSLYSDKAEDFFQIKEEVLKNLSEDPNRNEYDPSDPPLWETIGNFGQEDIQTKSIELTSEREVWAFCDNPGDTLKASRSENNAQDQSTELKRPSQQSTVSLTVISTSRIEESGPIANSLINKKDSETLKDDGDISSSLDFALSFSTMSHKLEDSSENFDNVKERLQSPQANKTDLADPRKKLSEHEEKLPVKTKLSWEGSSITFDKIVLNQQESQSSLNSPKESDNQDTYFEVSGSSSTLPQTYESSQSLIDSERPESSEVTSVDPQNFRLRSPKMYSGVNHEPDSPTHQECALTESEEAFIDETESVLQIIEPEEHSGDEDSSKVSFSLLSEISHGETSAPAEHESESEFTVKENNSGETESSPKKVYSGMTTIGPMKNLDYDPKDLTLPNIDYGKMTRITSSRQLAKEIDLFGQELSSAPSMKITEDDSDDELSLNPEDLTSLVNRDIASLTKVQKVREVMSHHPKPEDDFEDDDALPRPRLDLKDVESMTDERYKVPDVTIPLLSLEISDSDGTEKELIENMGLVLSSLTNPVFYEEEFDEDISEISKEQIFGSDYVQLNEESKNDEQKSETTQYESATNLEKMNSEEKYKTEEESTLKVGNTDSQPENISNLPKCGTLGSVFRKASNKFIRKDSDSFLRNSKSLPRDTSKITPTESIRSILDDCHSSATSMLKKSKSLLKNTQSLFKSMSSSRVSSDVHDLDNKKVSPSESDVSTLERKLSSFLRKEDFAKAKNIIKSKMEKTLHKRDSGNASSREEVSNEKKNLTVVIRDEGKLRVDKMENFKKFLPKSQLLYKSQFVKSQMSMQNESAEVTEVDSNHNATDGEQNYVEDSMKLTFVEERNDKNDRNDRIFVEETDIQKDSGAEINIRSESEVKSQSEPEIKISPEDKSQWTTDKEELRQTTTEDSEPQQPDYIVMETIQGLPTPDIDSPSREKDNETTEQQVERDTGDDTKKTEASNSFGACAEAANDVAPCFPELEEDKMATKTPSERKIKTKKKKLTARFRSFWCSAFGRVKTSPKKGDRS